MVTSLQKNQKHPYFLGILYSIFENNVNSRIILNIYIMYFYLFKKRPSPILKYLAILVRCFLRQELILVFFHHHNWVIFTFCSM